VQGNSNCIEIICALQGQDVKTAGQATQRLEIVVGLESDNAGSEPMYRQAADHLQDHRFGPSQMTELIDKIKKVRTMSDS
jgi:hypothetical protein